MKKIVFNSVLVRLLPELPRLVKVKPNTPVKLYEKINFFPVYKKNAFIKDNLINLSHLYLINTTQFQSRSHQINQVHTQTNNFIHKIYSYIESDVAYSSSVNY